VLTKLTHLKQVNVVACTSKPVAAAAMLRAELSTRISEGLCIRGSDDYR